MKVIVVGYGEMFCSLVAGVLSSGNEVVGVFRNENIIYSPIKRFLFDAFFPSAEKLFIRNLGLYDIKAPSVNSKEFISKVKKLDADVILTGSWSEKFLKNTIKSPKMACINTHPSLLPKYRGPNPYIQTILAGENESGITFHLMNKRFDSGKILHQAKTEITNEDTGFSLKLKCCELARKEIAQLLNNIEEKLQNAQRQNENEAQYFPLPDLKETILEFEKETSYEIIRRIRAFTPWVKCHIPHAQEFLEFEKYKLLDEKSTLKAGSIIKKTANSISIVCRDGRVIKFSYLKLKRPFMSLFTGFYLKYFIKIV